MVEYSADVTTQRAREMYDEYRFGALAVDRRKYNKSLIGFLTRIKKDDRVYDIGCGTGYFMEIYSEMGIGKDQITAVDLCPSNVENLRKNGYRAICADALRLPISDNASDFTICNGVLHHTRDPFSAFKELVRITKPGGRIFINVYNIWHPWFYIAHKATFPIRFAYWHWTKKIVNVAFPMAEVIYQPLALIFSGKTVSRETGMMHFMDQVITPHAFLFSKSRILSYAKSCNCQIEKCELGSFMYMMIAAHIRVEEKICVCR